MKKLMTVLASAATALFAFGETLTGPQGANFEAYSEGAVFDAQKDDLGTTSGNKFWYSTAAAGEIGDISNHVGQVAEALVPDYFKGDSVNNRYLHIDTSAPLFRSAVAHSNTFEPGEDYTFTGVDIGNGIYLDTLVQFTAADDEFQTNLDSGDKIAISYVEHEDDATTTDVNEAWTNFVIRAGAIVDNQFDQANYYATVPAGFEKDKWHRLTVRTIADVGDGQVGFIIYLDGDQTKALSFTNAVETGFTDENLNSLAKEYFVKNALYPSAVNSGTDKATISAASFSGTGALDDVVFTATKPGFIQEAATVEISWNSDVTGITIAGVAATAAELEAHRKVLELVGADPVTITITEIAAGKEARFATSGSGIWNGTSYTGLKAGDTVTITTIVPAFEFNGVHYTAEELDDLIEAAVDAGSVDEPATIKLLADCEQALAFTDGYIVLDLAGYDIQGAAGSDYSIGNAGATLVITNSGAEASILVPENGTGAMATQSGFTTVQAGTFEGAVITAADPEADEPTFNKDFMLITGGKFLDANYNPEDSDFDFYLADCVAQGLSYTKVGDYVQIGEGSPIIGTYTVTVTPTANATYAAAYKVGGETITPENNVLTVTVGQTIVITATPADGYEYATTPENWAAGQGGVITIEVSATGTVAIPAPTPVETPTTFALTTTGGANADVVTDPENVSALTKETEVTITATPKTDYTYTGVTLSDGWTLNTETGAISKTLTVSEDTEVAVPDAVSASGKTYPSYIGDDTAKGKYDTWATYAGISDSEFPDAQGTNKDAYLLNCKLDEVAAAKAAFKFTSISYDADQSKWVTTTTTSYNERAYNGTVTVTGYTDVGCTDGNENEAGPFFKATLD